jgi:purine-binding chemotaxis protein CheW
MVHLLKFSVAGIKGALPLDDTMQLVRIVKMGPVIGETRGVVGTLNLHGTSIPVYSARQLFGLADDDPCLTDNLIITRANGSNIALWVEETFVVQEDETISTVFGEDVPGASDIPGIHIFSDGLVLITNISLFLMYLLNPHSAKVCDFVVRTIDISSSELNQSYPGSSENSQRVRNILAERAETLALPEEMPHESRCIDVLTFQLVYGEYAVELRYVRESVLSQEITLVPGTPDHIIGILPVRGEIIPLIDLRVLLSIPDKGLTDLNQVIILTDGIITFGILADQITGITSVPVDQIGPPDSYLSPKKPKYIYGVVPDLVVLINAAEILSDPDMIVDDSVESETIPDIPFP